MQRIFSGLMKVCYCNSNLATLGHVLLTTHKRRVFPIGYRVFDNFLSEK